MNHKGDISVNGVIWNPILLIGFKLGFELDGILCATLRICFGNIDKGYWKLHSLFLMWISLSDHWKNLFILDAIIQYIPRNMHTVFALLCFVVVIHWLIFPYPSGLLHWHCGNLTIAPVPAKQPWWIWMNTSCEFIMNDCINTTKQSTTKPCAYFLGYTVYVLWTIWLSVRVGWWYRYMVEICRLRRVYYDDLIIHSLARTQAWNRVISSATIGNNPLIIFGLWKSSFGNTISSENIVQ